MTSNPQSVSVPRDAAGEAAAFPRWPYFAPDELAAVEQVLKSGRVNQWTGEEVTHFEREYAVEARTPYAIALANGTVALELALRSFGIGPGDEVITTPRTFVASASCAVMCGAIPVLADVDADSQNVTAATIARAITPKTRAIIVVHLAGWPCEMDEINALAREHGLIVIEDCAQANGATYRDRPVGGLANAAGFSFCQDKIITTGGEGGMLTLRDEAVWSRAWSFKDHGKSHAAVKRPHVGPGFRWLHESFGTNWRMTEMQAAIGRTQLRKLPEWSAIRRRNAQLFLEFLGSAQALRIPVPPSHIRHAFYKFYAFVRPDRLRAGWSRDRIMSEVSAAGVPCFSGSCSEIYREKAFTAAGLAPAEPLPVARELGETSLMFLVHPTLSSTHIERMAQVVSDVMERASK